MTDNKAMSFTKPIQSTLEPSTRFIRTWSPRCRAQRGSPRQLRPARIRNAFVYSDISKAPLPPANVFQPNQCMVRAVCEPGDMRHLKKPCGWGGVSGLVVPMGISAKR